MKVLLSLDLLNPVPLISFISSWYIYGFLSSVSYLGNYLSLCGVVWCGVVWCGAVQCGAVMCGVVWGNSRVWDVRG